jgi:hypothetical protein
MLDPLDSVAKIAPRFITGRAAKIAFSAWLIDKCLLLVCFLITGAINSVAGWQFQAPAYPYVWIVFYIVFFFVFWLVLAWLDANDDDWLRPIRKKLTGD